MKASPSLLEPIMSVEVTTPSEHQGSVVSTINKRRGIIMNSTMDGAMVVIEAEV